MQKTTDCEIRELWKIVYNLALNFLHDEDEAKDATQDVFQKVSLAYDSFRNESSLKTWVYRIAYNHLIDQRRSKHMKAISFDLFEEDVNNFRPFKNEIGLTETEMSIYIDQIKVGCTKAMLQCLGPIDRFVYIVGKLFEFSSKDGAAICEISEVAYRQRLSRASRKIATFVTKNCGLASDNTKCQCRARIGVALENRRINQDMLLRKLETITIADYLGKMNELDSVAEIFRDNPFVDKELILTDETYKIISQLSTGVIS